MSEESTAYDATVIVVLTGPEAVRKRPGMYIGSVGERGLHHLVFEAAEWALEEVIGGAGGRVVVTLTADGGVRIDHDGEALPVDHDGGGDSLRTRLTVIGGRARPAGRRSLDGGFATHGLGLSVVNALSSRLTAEVRRDGARWVLEYERGEEVAPPTRSGPAGDTGTVITFRPDAEVFEALEFSFDTLVGHFREVASLNRELDITLADDRDPGEPRADRLHFPGGLGEALAEQSCVSPLHPDVIAFEREYATMEGTVEVALRWCDSHEEHVTSYATNRRTDDGGVHELGFRDGLAAAANTYARERHILRPTDPDLTPAQLGAGLVAVVSVKVDHPEFLGARRDFLGNAHVRACVAEAVREHLTAWFHGHPAQAAAVLARISASPRG